MTRDRWERFAVWSALLVYFTTWAVIPGLALGADLWFVGVSLAAVYVMFHVFEITVRGHCYLSADSTAFPAVLVWAIALGIVLSVSGVASVTVNRLAYVQAFIFSYVLGHVLSIIYSALVNQLGVISGRAARRLRGGGGPLIPGHRGMAELSRAEEELKRNKE